MQSYYPVMRVLSRIVVIFSLTMLIPAILAWVYHDGAESAFDEATVLTIGTGLALWYASRHETRDLTIRHGFLMVALVWTVLPIYAALPLIIQLDASSPMAISKPFPD